MTTGNLVLASDLPGRPVVSIDSGDDVAEIRDIVFDPASHRVTGFTLNKRGWFRGRLKAALATDAVVAIGPDAVMVATAGDLVDRADAPEPLAGGDETISLTDTAVLTSGGEELGTVSDVIIETGPRPEAVGYQVTGENGDVFVPISAQLALSEDNLLLPADAADFVRNDLAGFGAAVTSYRQTLTSDDTRSTS